MSIRFKTMLIVSLTLVVMLGGLGFAARNQVRSGFLRLEEDYALATLRRLAQQFGENGAALESVAGDWGPWDATYNFVMNRDPEYIADNLSDAGLATLRVNFMLFLDNSWSVVHAKAIDLASGTEEPFPKPLLAALSQGACLNLAASETPESLKAKAGFIVADGKPVQIAAHPILRSDRSGPRMGTLIVGRFLNQAERDRLGNLAGQSFTIHPPSEADPPPEIRAVVGGLADSAAGILKRWSAERIGGYQLVRDLCDRPAFILAADMPREIYGQGRRTIMLNLLSILGIGVVMTIIVMVLLERSVLAPLSRLSHGVAQVGGPPHPREVPESGRPDEIGQLARAINDMTGRTTELNQALEADIAKRLMTEASLQESEARYRRLAENMGDVVWTIDPESLRFNYVSPSASAMTGYGPEELISLPLERLLSPESLDQTKEAMREAQTAGLEALFGTTAPFQAERIDMTLIRKDGRRVEVEIRISPLRDDGGLVVGILGVTRDMTDIKRAAVEKKRLEEQLYQSQKLQAIGTLAGGIAHDFNNILAAIIGYTELAQADIKRGNAVENRLERLLEAAGRARSLVQQILTFSRRQEEEKVSLNLTVLLDEALSLIRAVSPSSIEIRHQVCAAGSVVDGNATQLHQVIVNLCTNGLQAMSGSQGVLGVTLADQAWEEIDPALRFELKPGPYLVLAIRDTGVGMDAVVRKRIFEPFFTTKEQGKGTGMGLSVALGIVKGHGGTLSVESTAGKGSTFYVYLPRSVAAEAAANVSAPAPDKGQGRILLVDDESSIVDIGEQVLSRYGYTVEAFTEPLAALDCFRTRPEAFDLLITDQTMPHMTGDQLAEEIRLLRPEFPMILCTGLPESPGPEENGRRLFVEILAKPFSGRDLGSAVVRALHPAQVSPVDNPGPSG